MQPQCLLWAQQCWEQLCRNVWEATRKKNKSRSPVNFGGEKMSSNQFPFNSPNHTLQ